VSGEGGTVAVFSTSTCNGTDSAGCSQSPTTATVESDPRGDLFDPATNTVYVTNAGSDTVSMLDASRCDAGATAGCGISAPTFPAGQSPRRLAIDASTHTLYVVNTVAGTASVIDTRTCNATTTSGCPTQSPPGGGGAILQRGLGGNLHRGLNRVGLRRSLFQRSLP
jgi:DNA-binding beta-propeller fold protein YncE